MYLLKFIACFHAHPILSFFQYHLHIFPHSVYPPLLCVHISLSTPDTAPPIRMHPQTPSILSKKTTDSQFLPKTHLSRHILQSLSLTSLPIIWNSRWTSFLCPSSTPSSTTQRDSKNQWRTLVQRTYTWWVPILPVKQYPFTSTRTESTKKDYPSNGTVRHIGGAVLRVVHFCPLSRLPNLYTMYGTTVRLFSAYGRCFNCIRNYCTRVILFLRSETGCALFDGMHLEWFEVARCWGVTSRFSRLKEYSIRHCMHKLVTSRIDYN